MTDRRASGGALDVVLADRVEAQGRMAAALVELENHPGHRLLSTVTLTGRTAARWDAAREILTELWQDFGTYQAVVAAARTVRDRRARPGDREIAELRRPLHSRIWEAVLRDVPTRSVTTTPTPISVTRC